jgi:hypothetical protein
MTLRERITDDGWYNLLQAPVFLAIAMAGAEHHGPIGSANESTALYLSLEDLVRETGEPATGLKGEIADDMRALLSKETSKEDRDAILKPVHSRYKDVPPREIAMATIERVTAAVAGLEPDDTLGYREWLVRVASDVAESTTGGGLFRHGPRTSEAERALLAEIAAGLAVSVES